MSGPIDRLRLWVEAAANESGEVAEMDNAIDDALEEARDEVRAEIRMAFIRSAITKERLAELRKLEDLMVTEYARHWEARAPKALGDCLDALEQIFKATHEES